MPFGLTGALSTFMRLMHEVLRPFLGKFVFKSKLNYSTYDQEFYVVVRALEHWNHYLKVQPFVLHSDHAFLRYINGQNKLNATHGKWVEFLRFFTFSSKYKSDKANVIVEALSRRHHLLALLETKILGFEMLKELYDTDLDFEIYMQHVRKHLSISSIYKQDLYLKQIDCVYLEHL